MLLIIQENVTMLADLAMHKQQLHIIRKSNDLAKDSILSERLKIMLAEGGTTEYLMWRKNHFRVKSNWKTLHIVIDLYM